MRPKSIPIDSLALIPLTDSPRSLEFSREVEYEEFPGFVKKLMKLCGGTVVERTDTGEIRVWRVNIGGAELWAAWDEDMEGPLVSLTSRESKGDVVVSDLYYSLRGDVPR